VDLEADVLVVGGGILDVTTALAFYNAAVGSVQLIEASSLASGATGGSAGLLQPEPHHGSDRACLVDLARQGLQRWRYLETAIPDGIGLVEQDWIGLAPHPEDFVANPPPTISWLDEDQVARLIPGLAHRTAAARIERQARLNPQRAIARLARTLLHVSTGVTAQAVTVTGATITAVRTTAGTFKPGVVVFATGSPPRVDGVELDVPSNLIKRHLLVTDAADVDSSRYRRPRSRADRQWATPGGRHSRR
jgi:glycine/D-amino acid oxidase-like deaminating enzyme